MKTEDKDILQFVQWRLYKECFPNGYDEWEIEEEFNKTVIEQAFNEAQELTDAELLNELSQTEIQIGAQAINIDDFVSEMN